MEQEKEKVFTQIFTQIFTDPASWDLFIKIACSKPEYHSKLTDQFSKDLTVDRLSSMRFLATELERELAKLSKRPTENISESSKKSKTSVSGIERNKEIIVVEEEPSVKEPSTSRIVDSNQKFLQLLKCHLDSYYVGHISKVDFFREFQKVLKENGFGNHEWVTTYGKGNCRGPTGSNLSVVLRKVGYECIGGRNKQKFIVKINDQ
jgi:hypothetical protein